MITVQLSCLNFNKSYLFVIKKGRVCPTIKRKGLDVLNLLLKCQQRVESLGLALETLFLCTVDLSIKF